MSWRINLDYNGEELSFDLKKIEEKTNEYLVKHFSDSYYKFITNFFSNERILSSEIKDQNFQLIEKEYEQCLSSSKSGESATAEWIKLIKKGVVQVLEELYLEILLKLVSEANKDRIINKFYLAQINSLIKLKRKEIIWSFFRFLVKQKQLIEIKNFEYLNKKWIALVDPNVMLNLWKYGKLSSGINNKSNQINYTMNDIYFIDEPHLGMKIQLNQTQCNFSKIAFIFLPEWAGIIKWAPVINVYFEHRGWDIWATIVGKVDIKLFSDSIYLFS